MTATALPTQRTETAAGSRPGALSKVKKLFFPVAPAYLFMIIPAIVLFTFFIIYPTVQGMFWSLTNYLQEMFITGNVKSFTTKLDADWARRAARSAA